MKSERRHELQENSLIRGVRNLPTFWQESGSKVMLGVIVVLLVIAGVRWYLSDRTEKARQVAIDLGTAQTLLTELRETNFGALAGFPIQFNEQRQKLQSNAELAVSDVLTKSENPAQQAEAKLIRADLRWQLAQIGDPPAATTQPAARMKQTPGELMESAAKEYTEVAQQTGLPPLLTARAHLGLAAVAEEKGDWAAARTHYQAVTQDSRVPKAVQGLAKRQGELVTKLEQPVLLGRPTPSTQPSITALGPVFAPSTAPTTEPTTLPGAILPAVPSSGFYLGTPPAEPATSPATRPATMPVP